MPVRGRAFGWALLIGGVVLLLVAITFAARSALDLKGDVDQIKASSAALPSASTPASATTLENPSQTAPAASAPAPAETFESPVAVVPIAPPDRIRIPAIGVDSRVVGVGLDNLGNYAVPDDVDLIGWYELGVAPGESQGSVVMAGHRDGNGQGRGAFYSLAELDSGDQIDVALSDGETLAYQVDSVDTVSKSDFTAMVKRIFTREGDARLTLISCGGLYLPARGGYQANVIVTALPVGN